MPSSTAPHISHLPTPEQPFVHPLTAALRPPAPATPLSEHDTAPIEAPATEPIVDSYALLDHRSRRGALTEGEAPDGQYLAFEDGERTWLVALTGKLMHVGRGFAADVRIEHRQVSRSHAIVFENGRHARVLDDRSANGTFVNGRRIVATTLAEGDVIRLGPVVFRYVTVGPVAHRGAPRAAPATAAPPAAA